MEMTHLTPEQREHWELAKKATPGPWKVGDHPSEVISPCPCCGLIATCEAFGPPGTLSPECYNSDFIAAARTGYPAALEQVNMLSEQLNAAKGELASYHRAAVDENLARLKAEAELSDLKGKIGELERERDELSRLLELANSPDKALLEALDAGEKQKRRAELAESRLRKLREALKEYGDHTEECDSHSKLKDGRIVSGDCDCGFEAALREGESNG